MGCGDGRYVLNYARQNADTLCIGIDASREGLIEASRAALRKPQRGGAPNALFLLAAVESLPTDLCELADLVTLNYPWGSLLRAVMEPELAIMAKISRLAKTGAQFNILVNWSTFEDKSYCKRLELPAREFEDIEHLLKPAFREIGIAIKEAKLIDESPVITTWGQKLVKGSARRILCMTAYKGR